LYLINDKFVFSVSFSCRVLYNPNEATLVKER